MEVRIQGIHFDVTEKLNQFINKKADKLARRFPSMSYIDVILSVVKPETAMNKEAKLKVVVPHEGEHVATKVADSFEEAVDMCLEAVERQLEKNKGRES